MIKSDIVCLNINKKFLTVTYIKKIKDIYKVLNHIIVDNNFLQDKNYYGSIANEVNSILKNHNIRCKNIKMYSNEDHIDILTKINFETSKDRVNQIESEYIKKLGSNSIIKDHIYDSEVLGEEVKIKKGSQHVILTGLLKNKLLLIEKSFISEGLRVVGYSSELSTLNSITLILDSNLEGLFLYMNDNYVSIIMYKGNIPIFNRKIFLSNSRNLEDKLENLFNDIKVSINYIESNIGVMVTKFYLSGSLLSIDDIKSILYDKFEIDSDFLESKLDLSKIDINADNKTNLLFSIGLGISYFSSNGINLITPSLEYKNTFIKHSKYILVTIITLFILNVILDNNLNRIEENNIEESGLLSEINLKRIKLTENIDYISDTGLFIDSLFNGNIPLNDFTLFLLKNTPENIKLIEVLSSSYYGYESHERLGFLDEEVDSSDAVNDLVSNEPLDLELEKDMHAFQGDDKSGFIESKLNKNKDSEIESESEDLMHNDKPSISSNDLTESTLVEEDITKENVKEDLKENTEIIIRGYALKFSDITDLSIQLSELNYLSNVKITDVQLYFNGFKNYHIFEIKTIVDY